jgi:hypothetical protein
LGNPLSQDDRIRQNSKVFETVSAWTTLYQATLLNDDDFSELVINASKKGVLKVSNIRNVQDKKTKSPKSTYQNLLNVQFDWNAIKAQVVSSEDVQKVIEKLNEFASEIKYMKVEAYICHFRVGRISFMTPKRSHEASPPVIVEN